MDRVKFVGKKLWDQLQLELKDGRPTSEDREESLLNFIRTPYYLERVILFGTLTCLDSFVYVLTILPLRFALACIALARNWRTWKLHQSDVIKGTVSILTLIGLMHLNTSRVYHSIRGQAGVTLFVMFSIFEVTDKFCCAIGQDIVDSLVSQTTCTSTARTLWYSALALAYLASHSFVLLWQLVTLNVAVNSYSNALLSLMLTSQFGEVKSAVFKKFDLETLFQITCADITQRFQLAVMLAVIVLRNLLEPGPASSSAGRTGTIGPAVMVNLSVILVDWLKHSYIGNFNEFKPGPIYNTFLHRLVKDYVDRRSLSSHHLMMKTVGLPVLPLAIICIRMFVKHSLATPLAISFVFSGLLLVKLSLGILLERNAVPLVSQPASQKPSPSKTQISEIEISPTKFVKAETSPAMTPSPTSHKPHVSRNRKPGA